MMLLKPSPILAANDCRDGGVLYPVLFAQLTHVYAALRVTFANFSHLIFGELRDAMSFAAWLALLGYLVGYVVVIRAKKEMGGIAAKWIVATVAYMKTIRDWTNRIPVGNAVHQELTEMALVTVQPVSASVGWALPVPTVIGSALVYARPKALFRVRISPMLAKAVGKIVRGIITHVNSPFSTLTTPPNDSTRCGGNFMGCYSFIIPQEGTL